MTAIKHLKKAQPVLLSKTKTRHKPFRKRTVSWVKLNRYIILSASASLLNRGDASEIL